MKIISFEIHNTRDIKLLLLFAKALGIKQVKLSKNKSKSASEMVSSEIRKAIDDFDKDF